MSGVFYQVSTLNALMLGNFDGVVSVDELLRHGSWGIGTYEGLDGEAVICDGVAYDARATGEAAAMPASALVAFSTVADFSDHAAPFELDGVEGCDAMDAVLDRLETVRRACDDNENAWFLAAMRGTFPFVHVRSCFKVEDKPYPTLPEVASCQREFRYADERGWVVGVWVPAYLDGINLPGWHLHYLSDDRARGGHLLGLSIGRAEGRIESFSRYEMVMPGNAEFKKLDLTSDLSAATASVEG